jgi:nicotinamide-nucleotide amidase
VSDPLAGRAIELLTESGLKVAVAESLTGGLLLAALTAVPGASRSVVGGVVAYSATVKEEVLGVAGDLLVEKGSVDQEVAERMAQGVATIFHADIGVSTTGVAGPGPSHGIPAGTYWVAAAAIGESSAKLNQLGLGRDQVRDAAVRSGLKLLIEMTQSIANNRALR